MAHVFDAGLAQRGAIHDAIVAKLSPLLKSVNAQMYLRSIGTMPRPFRGEGDEKGHAMLTQALLDQAPAIAIALGRMTMAAGGGDATESDSTLEIAIYCASQHLNGTVKGRLYSDAISAADTSADPGLFVLLQHVRELLAGQELDVDGVSELRGVYEDETETFDNITVWEQRYEVLVNTTVNRARGIAELLTSIQDKHSVDDGAASPVLNPFVTTVTDIDPEDS
jgi:hypothetical protein